MTLVCDVQPLHHRGVGVLPVRESRARCDGPAARRHPTQGARVQGLGFWVKGLGPAARSTRPKVPGFRVQGLEVFMILGAKLKVPGVRVSGSGVGHNLKARRGACWGLTIKRLIVWGERADTCAPGSGVGHAQPARRGGWRGGAQV